MRGRRCAVQNKGITQLSNLFLQLNILILTVNNINITGLKICTVKNHCFNNIKSIQGNKNQC